LGLSLKAIIEIYEDIKQNYPLRAKLAEGMINICHQIQADATFPPLRFNLMKDMLVLGPTSISENLPPGFPTAISIYWIESDHYRIGIGFYETLHVSADKALFTIHHQLRRIQTLMGKVVLTEEELQEWKAHYLDKQPTDIEFLYSRQPSEWIINNLHQDIGYHIRSILRLTSGIEHAVKDGTMNEEEANKARDEALRIYKAVNDIFYTAEDIETKRRSEAFIQEHFE
jgi:hypothetical protein